MEAYYIYRTVRYIPAEAPLIITTDYGMFLLLKPALLRAVRLILNTQIWELPPS